MDTGRVGRKERVRGTEREAWKHTLPCVKQTAKGICCVTRGAQTGALATQRGGVGREVGGGSRGGDTGQPMADSC